MGKVMVLLIASQEVCLLTYTHYRSVHNVRIERLWVDVTAQVGATWADIFTGLELSYGLDINDDGHIWLLHHIFLPIINQQLEFFAGAWNMHRIQHRRGQNTGPSRSPIDMFMFDMYVHGVRGFTDRLPAEDQIDDAELEVYGVDWEALQDEHLLETRAANNPADEGITSWFGQTQPPQQLSGVTLDPPETPSGDLYVIAFDQQLQLWISAHPAASPAEIWLNALALFNNILA
jgi:hypothetical protein